MPWPRQLSFLPLPSPVRSAPLAIPKSRGRTPRPEWDVPSTARSRERWWKISRAAIPSFTGPPAPGTPWCEHDGQYFQRQWRVSPAGQEIHVQESRIDYVMGSGNHVRSYLHRTTRGALTELPLAWYAEKGGTWAMGPGHDRDYMLPPRTIAYECMFCHNAYPRIPAGHDEAGSEPLYAGDLPEGIDCQRCHGPGANHVRIAQTAGSSVDAIRKAIVNPARLPASGRWRCACSATWKPPACRCRTPSCATTGRPSPTGPASRWAIS